MRRHGILTVLLFTLLGNSGLACACALIPLDAPDHAHHGMSGQQPADDPALEIQCKPACGGHGSTALSGTASTLPDFHADKSSAPVLHYEQPAAGFMANTAPPRLHANRKSRPPSSTPVSRSDTLRD